MSEALRLADLVEHDPLAYSDDAAAELRRLSAELAALKAAYAIAAIEAQCVPDGLSDDDLSELAHSANQEALSFGLGHDLFLRYFRTLRNRAPASAPPAPQADKYVPCPHCGKNTASDNPSQWCPCPKQASVVQQEPVADIKISGDDFDLGLTDAFAFGRLRLPDGHYLLYTHPAQQAKPQPLTSDQKWDMWTAATIEQPSARGCYFRGVEDAEYAHGITKE